MPSPGGVHFGAFRLHLLLLATLPIVLCLISWTNAEIFERGLHGTNRKNEDIEIIFTYTNASGSIQTGTIRSKDLSDSWVWTDSGKYTDKWSTESKKGTGNVEEDVLETTDEQFSFGDGVSLYQRSKPVDPVKLWRKKLRLKRKENRTLALLQLDKSAEYEMERAAVKRTMLMKNSGQGKYGIWRKEFENPHSESTLKLMRDQIIMAKVYATIARGNKDDDLYHLLMERMEQNQEVIGEATSDAELRPGALDRAKDMGRILSVAKDRLYECNLVARKLRAMIQSTEVNIAAQKKKSAFLIQYAAKTLTNNLHCLSMQLTTDYLLHLNDANEQAEYADKLTDPSLYHYAIFSDNVLATSVVVNSTTLHTKEPEKHVFHIVTDKLNFAAMKMWFLANSPLDVVIQVENIDDFKWLNSSYCSVLRQLESARLKEYYFKANHPTTISAGEDNLKYRNPKYLSMLNHLRFYLPEVYPKLDKILFLDDDIVVQKDLTPLWSIDMKGMVNGAVETCKESFHRFDKYLNFSNPKISDNFDPNACGWAFGMNMFDLKEWKKRNITGIYHRWQDMNEDRTLWKLGSLPPGLITFYNLTYPLDRRWHVLGLGYDPALNLTQIDNAGVIHYNGNYKPWLDLAILKYKPYWSKFLMPDNPYLRRCQVLEATS